MNNAQTRIKQRIVRAQAVLQQLAGSVLCGFGAIPDQHTPTIGHTGYTENATSSCLTDKYSDAKEWARYQLAEIESRAAVMRVMDTSSMIASALNAVSIKRKRSWFSRIFGA